MSRLAVHRRCTDSRRDNREKATVLGLGTVACRGAAGRCRFRIRRGLWRVLELVGLLVQTVAISLSGVMAPGPITAATLTAGAQRAHAGFWIALGHALIEVPLIILLARGVGEVLESRRTAVTVIVGTAGGMILIWLSLIHI